LFLDVGRSSRRQGRSPSETWLGELIKRGADIVELNTARKRLSRVKGGKLLRLV
jgi:hypothetical protein